MRVRARLGVFGCSFSHLLEGRLELVQVLAAGSRQLGLDARLEATLGLGHELGAHVVPRGVVGRGDGDGRVRKLQNKKVKRQGR